MGKINIVWTTIISIASLSCAANSPSAPFPQWLRQRSGLDDWPGSHAPYIAETFHNMDEIREVPQRQFGHCEHLKSDVEVSHSICSFDCDKCVAPGDILTCPRVSQSFDDGPTDFTPVLLDGLLKSETKTTFFVIGLNVIKRPEIVRRELREHHEVAVHTWSHRFLPSLSNEEIFAELQWGIWAINATVNKVPKYFRPPYGGVDNRVRDIANQLGLKVVLWKHDTGDWKLASGRLEPEDVYHGVKKVLTHQDMFNYTGGLILEHDNTAESVAAALEINDLLGSNQNTVSKCKPMVKTSQSFSSNARPNINPKINANNGSANKVLLVSNNGKKTAHRHGSDALAKDSRKQARPGPERPERHNPQNKDNGRQNKDQMNVKEETKHEHHHDHDADRKPTIPESAGRNGNQDTDQVVTNLEETTNEKHKQTKSSKKDSKKDPKQDLKLDPKIDPKKVSTGGKDQKKRKQKIRLLKKEKKQ